MGIHQKFALLGASRGLGWETYRQLCGLEPEALFLVSSRQILKRQSEVTSKTQLVPQDFSKRPVSVDWLHSLQKFNPSTLIYFAGGGPYGPFADKKWSDHQWALNTTFLFPAELLHLILSKSAEWPALKQVIMVGSAIAENQPDPGAASYAAAKHALRGLVTTLQSERSLTGGGREDEKAEARPRVQLFSPGYMQTDLLPRNSQPRQNDLAEKPEDVAKKLIALIEKND